MTYTATASIFVWFLCLYMRSESYRSDNMIKVFVSFRLILVLKLPSCYYLIFMGLGKHFWHPSGAGFMVMKISEQKSEAFPAQILYRTVCDISGKLPFNWLIVKRLFPEFYHQHVARVRQWQVNVTSNPIEVTIFLPVDIPNRLGVLVLMCSCLLYTSRCV